MKFIRTIIAALIPLFFAPAAAYADESHESEHDTSEDRKETLFYRIRLDSDIDKAAERLVSKGLGKALGAEADYVILDLDTYGGAVDAADSIRSAILQCPIPVVAYVNLQAASAGALISIACDSIYMKPGSSIGAATVVNQSGKVMPDKYQSFMRGMMRSTAEVNGRDPKIAESMVDTANLLSLTPDEAVAAGFCEGICSSLDEVANAVLGAGTGKEEPLYRIENMSMTWIEKLVQLLLNPFLQSIFLMMIIGGIYVEIRTPGIGLPLVTAVVGALLYFAPLYVENLAQNWEILLFVIGLLLVGRRVVDEPVLFYGPHGLQLYCSRIVVHCFGLYMFLVIACGPFAVSVVVLAQPDIVFARFQKFKYGVTVLDRHLHGRSVLRIEQFGVCVPLDAVYFHHYYAV